MTQPESAAQESERTKSKACMMKSQTRTGLFPGSFDPFTVGHADVVRRALPLFDHIIIAVGYNEHKAGWMPIEQRVQEIKALYREEARITVESYSCLTADFAREKGVTAIIRGVRSVKDYEYELQIADVNRQLTGIETILLFADPKLASISSSVVRELAHFGKEVDGFIATRRKETKNENHEL